MTEWSARRSIGALLGAFVIALSLIAWASPAPNRVTDRDVYERTAARIIVPDCTDLHCFRVLVPWILGRLPGPSLVRWKAYAVLCNAASGAAVFVLCLTCGMTRRAAVMASGISAFGFGSLYTLHDCYTSDPLMFAVGPFITNELLNGRVATAATVATIGVFAKEFAAAPGYIMAGYHAIERRFADALRTVAAANAASIAWLLLTLTLMVKFNYAWGGTESANFSSGAGIGPWLQRMGPRGIASAMFNEFGALYVLAPVGFFLARRPFRVLAIVSIPVAAVFAYVQQPDRALWNFHFVVAPMAAAVLERAAASAAWGTIALFAVGNLRVGAQLPIAAIGRGALVGSVLLAIVSATTALRQASVR